MIKNSKICCYNNFCCNGRRFYLKVTNKGTLYVQFILQYTVHTGTATKKSKLLNMGQSDMLIFSYDSSNVCFSIFNYSLQSTPLICHGCIPVLQNTCFDIQGTAEHAICVQVPCKK